MTASAVSGEVTVTGNGGKSAVSTENVSGTSTVTGVRGNYKGEVVSGEIHATIAAAERIELNSVSGDIELRSRTDSDLTARHGVGQRGDLAPAEAARECRFDVETFSGDIENCFGPKARDTSKYTPGSELNFTQGSGGARVEMQTLSGEIKICDR